MSLSDIIGIFGVALILIAYFLNVIGKLTSDNKIFITLNILGSGIACLASYMIKYWPFVILEGTWFLVSIYGFFNIEKKK
ncbi:MAG TPA: hypothetical protein PK275_05100 [Chitinophagaceae bacterium]|nr:hypothetical protein [Chitinophagaceae bacterium]